MGREQKRDNVVTDKPKGKGDVEFYPRFQTWEAMITIVYVEVSSPEKTSLEAPQRVEF